MIWAIIWISLIAISAIITVIDFIRFTMENKILKENLAAITRYAVAVEEQNKTLKKILNIKDTED